MTACAHGSKFFPGLVLILLALLFAPALWPAAAGAASTPDAPYNGPGPLSGNNTYSQVSATRNPFTVQNGTLTLTGNTNGALFVTTSHASPRMNVSSDAGNATLVLQKGTFAGTISLGGNANTSTLVVGAGGPRATGRQSPSPATSWAPTTAPRRCAPTAPTS